jgi:hypothetical protein
MARVSVETAEARVIAAVYERVPPGRVGVRVKPNLDKVYAFLAEHPEVKKPGAHNILFYRRDIGASDGLIGIEFGVEVSHPFEGDGPVFATWVPPGRIATVTHVGPYDRLGEAHETIHQWRRMTAFEFADADWEIYGDWNDDPAKLETKVCYLLK